MISGEICECQPKRLGHKAGRGPVRVSDFTTEVHSSNSFRDDVLPVSDITIVHKGIHFSRTVLMFSYSAYVLYRYLQLELCHGIAYS